MVPSRVAELETLLAKIRHANASLLDIDMWDRWGRQHSSAQEIAEREAHGDRCAAERTALRERLTALVAKLRAEQPEAVAAWADAHDAFLAAFVEESTRPDSPSRDSTALFVAKQEREGWAAVKRGELAFVDENCFYITIDRNRYRALFGIDP